MSKRGPTSELNHDNWDDEDASDTDKDALGGFAKATPEQLERRLFRVAKRRSIHSSGTPTNSPFSTFGGFGAKSSPIDLPKPSFSLKPTASPALNNGHKDDTSVKLKIDSPVSVATPKEDTSAMSKKRTRVESPKPTPSSQEAPDYFAHLKSLNIAVSKWVSKHVEENPFCILTPVFTDYAKHLSSIEKFKRSPNLESAVTPEVVISKSSEEKKETIVSSTDSTEVKDEKVKEMETETETKLSPVVSSPVVSSPSIVEVSPECSEIEKIDSPASSISTSSSVSLPTLKVSSESEAVSPVSTCGSGAVTTPNPSKTLFGTPVMTTPLGGNISSPSIFQTPSASSPSVFGSLKTSSGSLFGSSTTTEASKTGFNPSALTFSFGSSAAAPLPSNATFRFGSSNAISSGASGFSFAGLAAKAAEQLQAEVEEPEEPPKVDFTPVQEEGSEYEIRCKVFIKKDDEYKERGIGMLYLKPGEKTQLLVRTATTTGQILLNTLVTSSLMPTRVGKNNVQIVCIPTPNEEPPPAIMLIRVKTSEDADELLSKIKEHIK